jgi:sec-independent protein translocase protein TatA
LVTDSGICYYSTFAKFLFYLEYIMGISIWQLLIILAIVLVIFGAKRLKNLGSDLGGAIKGFKKAVSEEDEAKAAAAAQNASQDPAKLENNAANPASAPITQTTQVADNVFDAKATEKPTDADKPKV